MAIRKGVGRRASKPDHRLGRTMKPKRQPRSIRIQRKKRKDVQKARIRAENAKSRSNATSKSVPYNGHFYRIPIDANGYVPLIAMVQRYQKYGDPSKDGKEDSKVIFPRRARPEDIVMWWADPSSADIRGLDTRRSVVYDVGWIKDKRMREVQSRIGIVTPSKKEQRRIRTIIAESYTADELDAMTRDGSFVIETTDSLGMVTGYYLRRQDGVEVPLISLEKGTTADGVVHEVNHHARTTRPPGKVTSCPFPVTKDGRFDQRAYDRLSDRQKAMLHDAEETATVAETVVRTRTDRVQSGYYDRVGGRAPYLADRQHITRKYCNGTDCNLVGAKAVKATQDEYDRMEIAKARIMAPMEARDSVKVVCRPKTRSGASKKRKGGRR